MLQRRHIDDIAEPDVTNDHLCAGIVDRVDGDDLNIKSDAMFGAKIEHLLRFDGDAADQRTDDRLAWKATSLFSTGAIGLSPRRPPASGRA